MLGIQVLGTGEAFDSELGNTSYLFKGQIRSQKYPTILFDCGYQVPERLWAQELHIEIDAVCLTHLHADHAFGLVPLLARYGEERRSRSLKIFGPRGTEAYLTKLFGLGYPGFMKRLNFNLSFVELNQSNIFVWKGLRLKCARTIHSVLNHTIKIEFIRERNLSFAISGDGQMTEATRDLVFGVTLLLQEVYSLKSEVSVHSDLQTIERFMVSAPLRQIGVVHQSRLRRSQVHQRVTELKKNDPRWFIVQPGMLIPLRVS